LRSLDLGAVLLDARSQLVKMRAQLSLGMLRFCLDLGLETIEAAVGLGELGFQIFGVPVELLARTARCLPEARYWCVSW